MAMREVVERNVYEILKLAAAGCVVMGFVFLVASTGKGADAADWILSALRMWGFAVGVGAIAMFIDGRRQMRRA